MDSQPINRFQLKQMQATYEAGFKKCAETLGLLKPCLSLRQCYNMWGRGTVDRWIKEGLVTVKKDGTRGNKCRICREEIELVAAMSNRASWYEHQE